MGRTSLNLTQRKYVTGTGNISYSFTPGSIFHISEIRLHLSAVGGANNLIIKVDSSLGTAYDTVLITQDMTLITDYVFRPEKEVPFIDNDAVVVTWTNGSSRTYGLEILYVLE